MRHPSQSQRHRPLIQHHHSLVMMIDVDWRQPFIDYTREQKVPY
jgi:hypothetical protein